ncbi:hypothetical protein CRUP_010599 [Coryphaenoides rupestris]|nr:hypothetical protein CRUP_010599 [Coryphaenoides rupestris]
MSPCGSTLEEQLSSIMEVLAKAAVSEISQLFSEGSAALRFQISRSLKENEALRTRMKVMRSELCSLRLTLQTKSSASRAASRSALARVNMSKPRTKPLGHGLKPMMVHKAVGDAPSLPPFKSEASSVAEKPALSLETPACSRASLQRVCMWTPLAPPTCLKPMMVHKAVGDAPSLPPFKKACAKFGDPSMQQGITSESLHVDAPGSSHMSSRNEQLRILCVYGKGEGPLAVDSHDTLFTGLDTQGTLSSLPSDHSVTHDSLLGLDSGPSERVPARGMQDGTGGPSRDDHAERLHRLQVASRSLKHASVLGDNRGRGLGRLGAQFPLQQPKLGFPHGTGKNLGCSFSGKRIFSRKLLNSIALGQQSYKLLHYLKLG